MAKGKIKITIEIDPLDFMKESREDRKRRIQNSKPMGTKVEPKKKAYNRKQKHKKRWEDYE